MQDGRREALVAELRKEPQTVERFLTVSFWSVEEPQAWDFDVKSQKCLGYGNVHEFQGIHSTTICDGLPLPFANC